MKYFIIGATIVLVLEIFIIWKYKPMPKIIGIILKQRIKAEMQVIAERLDQTIQVYHETEVVPIQEALRLYPTVIAEIHSDLDILFSDGQLAKQPAKPKVNNPIDKIIDDEEEIPYPKN